MTAYASPGPTGTSGPPENLGARRAGGAQPAPGTRQAFGACQDVEAHRAFGAYRAVEAHRAFGAYRAVGAGQDPGVRQDVEAPQDAGVHQAVGAFAGSAVRDVPGPSSAERGGRPPAYDAVVLAGGAARRLGGADKPGVRVGGRALLDRVLSACADARTTVVVADPRPTARPVRWAREEPPGGGPLAALDAGLRHTTADHVVVLSADLPFLGPDTVGGLLAALGASDADGVLLTDGEGRDQPLVAAYRAAALHRALAALADPTPTDASGDPVPSAASAAPDGPVASTASATSVGPPVPGDPVPPGTPAGGACTPGRASRRGLAGLPLRRLVAALDLVRVVDRRTASFDCDTWDDIATARARIREHGHVLDEWISAVKDELGIDLDVDTGVLLDLARDAAHGVARPAAPLTTFLVGYAAARAEGGPEAVAEAARKAAALALRWADEDTPGQDTPGQDTPGQDTPGQGTAGEPDVAPDATPDTRPDAG